MTDRSFGSYFALAAMLIGLLAAIALEPLARGSRSDAVVVAQYLVFGVFETVAFILGCRFFKQIQGKLAVIGATFLFLWVLANIGYLSYVRTIGPRVIP